MGYFDDQEAAIARKQKIAAMLMQGNPGNTQLINTGRFMVPNLGVIGDAISNHRGMEMDAGATKEYSDLTKQKNERLANILSQGMKQYQAGDQAGALQTFAQDESTAPYAKALMAASLRQTPDRTIDAAKLKLMQDKFEWEKSHPAANSHGDTFGTTFKTVDKDGIQHVWQLGRDGNPIEQPIPPGQKVVAETPWDKRDLDTQAKIDAASGTTEAKATAGEQAAAKIGFASANELANDVYSTVDTLSKHPGVEGITGAWGAFPNAPWGNAAAAETLRSQLTGKAFIQMRQVLKGGGQITDYEGQRAEDSAIRAQKAQNKEDFVSAINEYKQHVARGLEIMRRHSEGDFSALPQDWVPNYGGQASPQAAPTTGGRPPLSSFGGK